MPGWVKIPGYSSVFQVLDMNVFEHNGLAELRYLVKSGEYGVKQWVPVLEAVEAPHE